MNTVEICIRDLDYENASKDTESAIDGRIYIDVDGYCFPHKEWYDLVSSILDMWTTEVVEFIYCRKLHCRLYFMDGPFFVDINVLSKDNLSLTFIKNDRKIANTIVQYQEFITKMLNCVFRFIEECEKKAPWFIQTKTFARIISSCERIQKTGDGSLS